MTSRLPDDHRQRGVNCACPLDHDPTVIMLLITGATQRALSCPVGHTPVIYLPLHHLLLRFLFINGPLNTNQHSAWRLLRPEPADHNPHRCCRPSGLPASQRGPDVDPSGGFRSYGLLARGSVDQHLPRPGVAFIGVSEARPKRQPGQRPDPIPLGDFRVVSIWIVSLLSTGVLHEVHPNEFGVCANAALQ